MAAIWEVFALDLSVRTADVDCWKETLNPMSHTYQIDCNTFFFKVFTVRAHKDGRDADLAGLCVASPGAGAGPDPRSLFLWTRETRGRSSWRSGYKALQVIDWKHGMLGFFLIVLSIHYYLCLDWSLSSVRYYVVHWADPLKLAFSCHLFCWLGS